MAASRQSHNFTRYSITEGPGINPGASSILGAPKQPNPHHCYCSARLNTLSITTHFCPSCDCGSFCWNLPISASHSFTFSFAASRRL